MSEGDCALTAYTAAVARRRAIDKTGNCVNMAILLQLERNDLPLLLELIEQQAKAIKKIIDLIPDEDEENMMNERMFRERLSQMGVVAAENHLAIDMLAQQGSTARWGDVDVDPSAH